VVVECFKLRFVLKYLTIFYLISFGIQEVRFLLISPASKTAELCTELQLRPYACRRVIIIAIFHSNGTANYITA
jgi:hypothetical protein